MIKYHYKITWKKDNDDWDIMEYDIEKFNTKKNIHKLSAHNDDFPIIDVNDKFKEMYEKIKDNSISKTVNKSLKKTSNATAKYFCENRNMILQKIPSYLCNETGTVRLTIKVNPKGEVTDCKVDNSKTNTFNQCLIENAINYAKNWKFNQDFSSTLRQEGWIEFIYLSQ